MKDLFNDWYDPSLTKQLYAEELREMDRLGIKPSETLADIKPFCKESMSKDNKADLSDLIRVMSQNNERSYRLIIHLEHRIDDLAKMVTMLLHQIRHLESQVYSLKDRR